MTKELSDDQIIQIAQRTETAEPGRDGYVLPISFARAIIAATAVKSSQSEPSLDTKRLEFIEANPSMILTTRKGYWSFNGFTSYEYETFRTLRGAIDFAIAIAQP